MKEKELIRIGLVLSFVLLISIFVLNHGFNAYSKEDLDSWLITFGKIWAILGSLVAAFIGYLRLVFEKGLFPPTEFSIECKAVGKQGDQIILEILLSIKNMGSSTLVVKNLGTRIRFLLDNYPFPRHCIEEDRIGRLEFPCNLEKCLIPYMFHLESGTAEEQPDCSSKNRKKENDKNDCKGFPVVPYDTFILPGVEQVYSFISSIPDRASFVLVHASFNYPKITNIWQKIILKIAAETGLINYSLKNVNEPHTCERVFEVKIGQVD
jgi:hypothetical protein